MLHGCLAHHSVEPRIGKEQAEKLEEDARSLGTADSICSSKATCFYSLMADTAATTTTQLNTTQLSIKSFSGGALYRTIPRCAMPQMIPTVGWVAWNETAWPLPLGQLLSPDYALCGKNNHFGICCVCLQMLVLPLTSYVTLDKLF